MGYLLQRIVDEDDTTKPRRIVIFKQEVYREVELHTFKYTEGNDVEGKTENAISADATENIDGAVIARLVKFRDAELRKHIRGYLAKERSFREDDILDLNEVFVYHLELEEEFLDSMLDPLAEYFHRFLAWGALYDWYRQMGLAQAKVYEADLAQFKEAITGILGTPSYAKRPLQPFGPAERIFPKKRN